MTIPPAQPPDPGGHRNDYTGDARTAVQVGTVYGGLRLTTTARRTGAPVPAQLRAAPACWTDRGAELQTLTSFTTPTAIRPHEGRTDSGNAADEDQADLQALIVITGPGGVGKTGLALQWLHQRRARYCDGQLSADLRAFSGTSPPADPAQILEGFLRALGIAPIPPAGEEQSAMFRSVAARRRLIILLDNAASAAQVRPLLPGAGRNLVVVTSRRTLPGLRVQGAQYLELAPLDETGALDLLTAMAGDRAAADPHAARALTAQCGRLPLALTACAAHLATRPHTTLPGLVDRLAAERTRLHRLSTLLLEDNDMNDNTADGDTGADPSVTAALTTSYNALNDAAQRMYRLLGQHPGPDLDLDLAAATAGLEHQEADQLLNTLTDARLLTEGPAGRFRYHDLAQLHARDTSARTDPDDVRAAAANRVTARLLQVAAAAQKTVNPGRWYLGECFTKPQAAAFPSPVAALDWLETEQHNLLAVLQHAYQHGDPTDAWQICEAMWGLFTHRKHFASFQRAHQTGLAAARITGDLRAQARMLEGLASYHANVGTYTDGIACALQALDLERRAGHRIGEASALDMLGVAQLASGRLDQAGDAFAQACSIHDQLGRPRGAALMTRHLGEVAARSGDHRLAIERYTQAIAYFGTQEGEQYLHARALSHRALSQLELGHLDQAHDDLGQAMGLAQRAGAPPEMAHVHTALARLAELRQDSPAQKHHLRQALDIYREIGAPQADHVAAQLAQRFPPTEPGRNSPQES